MTMKKLFNLNKGFYIERRIFSVDGYPSYGYVIYREYVIFGLPGLSRLSVCSSLVQLSAWVNFLGCTKENTEANFEMLWENS